jgi:hypothetical protein
MKYASEPCRVHVAHILLDGSPRLKYKFYSCTKQSDLYVINFMLLGMRTDVAMNGSNIEV